MLEELARLVDAEMAFNMEMADVLSGRPKDLGYADWGVDQVIDRALQIEVHHQLADDPSIYGALNGYFLQLGMEDGCCRSAQECNLDGSWHLSSTYKLVHRPLNFDHALFCYRSLSGLGNDFSGIMLQRRLGRPEFRPRARTLVRELQAIVVPMMGGPLARFIEPSPLDLSPQLRRVLACILEGDSDKQIAARLRLSRFTVNEYTKRIFKHFKANGRAELMARWIRRGWGDKFSWQP